MLAKVHMEESAYPDANIVVEECIYKILRLCGRPALQQSKAGTLVSALIDAARRRRHLVEIHKNCVTPSGSAILRGEGAHQDLILCGFVTSSHCTQNKPPFQLYVPITLALHKWTFGRATFGQQPSNDLL